MRKRARLTAPKDDEFNPDDYISPLPNDILISILSRLTFKEAAITSNLSRRWRYL
ncbi:putative F-box/LRR-repeat protein at3g58880 [Phtheirospermum japonicum]|uniref:Putative F-box/LRR-repeat protein at3g58880 n=1 Tax=Phtheirospermum japonicum TaxID=374723 RepID=A0A830BNK4_9LAMI|nr:putative F-box/LRR-repeat protein at3g58880 [Phtheirospermum japonicum]